MKYQEEEISELRWLGRRMDNLYSYIQQNDPDVKEYFLSTIGNFFEQIILIDLNQDEEDYLFETIDREIDRLEEKYETSF